MTDEASEEMRNEIGRIRKGLLIKHIHGEWEDEPDHIEFQHRGYPCLMVRNRMMVWCGYAAVTKNHPLYGKNYNDVDLSVHGGLTYSDKCQGPICHIPAPGQSDDVWWFGFDCGHAFDYVPTISLHFDEDHSLARRASGDTYRTAEQVKMQCESLVDQLRNLE